MTGSPGPAAGAAGRSDQAGPSGPAAGPAGPVAAEWPVLAAVSVGGALGALARYGALLAWPAPDGGFPWTVFGINVLGCALIGVLMARVAEGGRRAHPLARPFLGVGVLGGFTSFSTYAMDVDDLLGRGEAVTAAVYAAGTVAGALVAVWAGAGAVRWALRRRTGEET
ncbi:fluoride efflux transporter FluC [Streptomyces sp. NPDC051561]|uniref:fluoride efflux transporter FluC n=1 Tax=Streptomyces sp. NPDC051561 TaxID=3365658 RepID=UPI0037905827